MKMIWVMWALVSAIARCQPEGQLTVSATHSIVVIAALQDQEEILSLKAIIDREDIPATALARWCKQHGFLMLPASSREGAAYLFSNRVLRSGAVALQQIMQLLEAGNPIPVVPDNPIYNDLEILVKINESVRLKDLKSFLHRYDYAAVMPSGEITATVNIGEDVYILDIGQIYEVNKAMFPSEEQSVPEGKVRNRQKDTPENTLDSTWVIHFMGLIPLSDKERNEVLTEALMLQRQFIEKEEQMYKQSIQSLIRQMEQRLHERESLEAGRWYSMDELPQRWQVLLGQALAERGVTQANMANAQVRFSVAPGLQFLLKKGEQRHVLGFRLSEPRVFTYTLNSSKP